MSLNEYVGEDLNFKLFRDNARHDSLEELLVSPNGTLNYPTDALSQSIIDLRNKAVDTTRRLPIDSGRNLTPMQHQYLLREWKSLSEGKLSNAVKEGEAEFIKQYGIFVNATIEKLLPKIIEANNDEAGVIEEKEVQEILYENLAANLDLSYTPNKDADKDLAKEVMQFNRFNEILKSGIKQEQKESLAGELYGLPEDFSSAVTQRGVIESKLAIGRIVMGKLIKKEENTYKLDEEAFKKNFGNLETYTKLAPQLEQVAKSL